MFAEKFQRFQLFKKFESQRISAVFCNLWHLQPSKCDAGCQTRKLVVRMLMKGIQPLDEEKLEFVHQKSLQIIALIGIFSHQNARCNEQKRKSKHPKTSCEQQTSLLNRYEENVTKKLFRKAILGVEEKTKF